MSLFIYRCNEIKVCFCYLFMSHSFRSFPISQNKPHAHQVQSDLLHNTWMGKTYRQQYKLLYSKKTKQLGFHIVYFALIKICFALFHHLWNCNTQAGSLKKKLHRAWEILDSHVTGPFNIFFFFCSVSGWDWLSVIPFFSQFSTAISYLNGEEDFITMK